jgi:hypothetical protein
MVRLGKLVRAAALAALLVCLSAGAASAASLPAGMTWSGDLSTGNFSQFSFLEQCPGDISQTASPAPAGAHAVALAVSDNDTESACPGRVFTPNPAASLIGPTMFHNGDDAWMGFSVYFPASFPTIPTWFQFAEVYGHPYGGSPPIGLDIEGNRMGLWRDATHNMDNPWGTPVVTGAWQDFVLHVKFSPDPSVGFVELWLNGIQQSFADGSTRLYYSTLVPGNNWDGGSGGDYLDIDQYRSHLDHLGTVTVYDSEMAIGTSYSAVAPRLHFGIVSPPTTGSAKPAPIPAPRTTPPSTPRTTPRSRRPVKGRSTRARKHVTRAAHRPGYWRHDAEQAFVWAHLFF